MTQDDPNSFLMGSGGRSAAFKQHNDEVDGVIASIEMRQQTKIGTNEPMTWDDGNPRMQMVVTLQTTGDAIDDDDDMLRKVYVRGALQGAVRNAVLEAGEAGLDVGGRLFVRYVSDAEPKQAGMSGAKQYFAKYAPPDRSMAVPEGGDDGPPADYEDPEDLPW